MLQCQPWPEKQNLHLSLNMLNFKPLDTEAILFSEPVSCEETHPSRKTATRPSPQKGPSAGETRTPFSLWSGRSVFITARL